MDQRPAEDATEVRIGQKTRNAEMTRAYVGILMSSSAGSAPLCEIASEWTPIPQPLVVDSLTEDMVPKPQDSGIRRVQARSIRHDCRRQHCGERRRENVDLVKSRCITTEESDFPSGQRQQGTCQSRRW